MKECGTAELSLGQEISIIILNIQRMRTINFKQCKNDYNMHKVLMHSASINFISPQPPQIHLNTQKSQVSVPTNQLEHEFKQYEWRQKTEFPIVKILNFSVIASNTDKTFITVQHETFPIRLSELKDLPLFKILYLLKEAIIGFERLFDKIGCFKITPKMVAVSQKNKCKVWLSQNFASNIFQKCFGGQRQFLKVVFSLFEERGNKLKKTSQFFTDFQKCSTFCQALSYIQNYARQNKINISTAYKVAQSEKLIVQNQMGNRTFDPSLTMGRAPKFLCNNLMGFKHDNKQILSDVFKRYSADQNDGVAVQHKNLQMKTSGDTAADNNGGKQESLKILQDELITSVVFQDQVNYNNIKPVFQLANSQKKLLFTRNFSDQNYQIHCHTPIYQKKTWQEQHHQFESQWIDSNFLGDDSEQQLSSSNITGLFSKNNWQQTLNGLFLNESPLKNSFHHGKQTRKTEVSTKILTLLNSINRPLHQSRINDQ